MSYILDALKRAESERSRGEVPNIYGPASLTGEAEADGRATGRLGVIASVALALLLAALFWWWWASGAADSGNAAERVASAVPPVPASVLPASVLPATVAAPPGQQTEASRPKPYAPTLPPAVRPKPAAPVQPVPPLAPVAALASVAASAAVLGAANPASTEARVYALKELPGDIRNNLPALRVGGATYSDSPASRMLIINGQLFREGDKLTPELTLQQIQLRSAVLSFRGYRYSISY